MTDADLRASIECAIWEQFAVWRAPRDTDTITQAQVVGIRNEIERIIRERDAQKGEIARDALGR